MARFHPLLGACVLACSLATAQDPGEAAIRRYLAALPSGAREAARALIQSGGLAVPGLVELLQSDAQATRPMSEPPVSTGFGFHVYEDPPRPEFLLPTSRWLRSDPTEGATYVHRLSDVHVASGPRVLAAWILGEIGDARAVGALTEATGEDTLQMRMQAVAALGEIGPPAIPGLGAALEQPISGFLAARLLAEAGKAAIPVLRDVLREGGPTAQRHALVALAELAPVGTVDVMPELMAAFASDDGEIRALAAWVLARGKGAGVPALMIALTDGDPELQLRAAGVLGLLGQDAYPAALLLVDHLQSRDEKLAQWCALALARTGVRGAGTARAVHELCALLEHGSRALQLTALDTLGEFGATSEHHGDALRAVMATAASGDEELRRKALALLGRFRGDAAVVVRPLCDLVRSGDEAAQCNAATALGRLGAAALPAVPTLIAALESPHNKLRAYAARALGQIGPEARDAAPSLRRAARDPVRYVADHARLALAKVEGRD